MTVGKRRPALVPALCPSSAIAVPDLAPAIHPASRTGDEATRTAAGVRPSAGAAKP